MAPIPMSEKPCLWRSGLAPLLFFWLAGPQTLTVGSLSFSQSIEWREAGLFYLLFFLFFLGQSKHGLSCSDIFLPAPCPSLQLGRYVPFMKSPGRAFFLHTRPPLLFLNSAFGFIPFSFLSRLLTNRSFSITGPRILSSFPCGSRLFPSSSSLPINWDAFFLDPPFPPYPFSIELIEESLYFHDQLSLLSFPPSFVRMMLAEPFFY